MKDHENILIFLTLSLSIIIFVFGIAILDLQDKVEHLEQLVITDENE